MALNRNTLTDRTREGTQCGGMVEEEIPAVGRIFHTASNIEVESLPITSERIGEQMMRGITLDGTRELRCLKPNCLLSWNGPPTRYSP